jgi:C1A family cysteine protease
MKRISIALLLLPVFAFAGNVTTLDVKALNNELKAKNVGWQADDTWLKKNGGSVKAMLGLQNPPNTAAEFQAPKNKLRSMNLPEVVDWRNMNGQNYVSPILNQGNCGSCVAFATVATLETQMNVNYFGGMFRFSPQALFSCGGGACEMGWMPSAAAEYLQSSGAVDEACLPYTSGATGQDVACSETCGDAPSRSMKIASYSQPTNYMKDVDSVKAALQKGPLVTTLTVYTDFLLYKSGVYKQTTGKAEGGHAISIIGYDDTKQAYIIRNSWGPDWGMDGFAYVSYDDISGVGSETYLFEAPKFNGFAAVRAPLNRSIVAGKITAQTETTFPSLTKVDVNVVDAKNHSVATASCTTAKCAPEFDTATWADGEYQIYSTVSYNGTTESSQRSYFYVVNTKSQLTLNFDPQGFDITQPVSGRIVFNVHGQSGAAPLSTVKMVVKQNGQTVYVRGSNVALPEMTLGWRTVSVPNGTYDVSLEGTQTIGDQTQTVESNHYTVNVNN